MGHDTKKRSGRYVFFRLPEVIVPAILLVVFLALVSPFWLFRTYCPMFDTVAMSDIKRIYEAAWRYTRHTGRWPELIDDFDDPMHPALERKDPWGHEYQYELADKGPMVWTLGRDNQVGGDDEDRDITCLPNGAIYRGTPPPAPAAPRERG